MSAADLLVAYGLVFLLASLVASLALGLLLRAGARLLAAGGPWLERRAAALALLLPPALAAGLVLLLAADSALALRDWRDHCLAHSHHLHVCLEHGAGWSSAPWALAAVAFAATLALVRLAQAGAAHLRAQRAAARLRRLGTPFAGGRAVRVPSAERFAFAAGLLRPQVIVSQGAWDGLSPGEREAVLAHELAHLEHGDLRWRALLGLAAGLGAPVLAGGALRIWEGASERLCDRRAAETVGRPTLVASAILALARRAAPPVPTGALSAAGAPLAARIESLLDEGPDGRQRAERLARRAAFAAALLAAGCAASAETLHHLLETILG